MHAPAPSGCNNLRILTLRALLTLFALSAPAQLTAQLQTIPLDRAWRFRAIASPDHPDPTPWHQVTVPDVVQTDLHHVGRIAGEGVLPF